MALRLRHVPHERRAVGTAGLHLPARPRACRASHRRHHHGAEPRLHGAGLFRCAHARLVEAADRRDGDLVHARRHARAAGPACREPVLPACRAGIARRLVMGRSPRDRRRSDDRDGRRATRRTSSARCSAGRFSRRSTSNAPSGLSAATSSTARSISGRCSRRGRCSGHADYRGPMPGLYMCGSGTHPGGGVTGIAGAQCREGSVERFEEAMSAGLPPPPTRRKAPKHTPPPPPGKKQKRRGKTKNTPLPQPQKRRLLGQAPWVDSVEKVCLLALQKFLGVVRAVFRERHGGPHGARPNQSKLPVVDLQRQTD